MEFDVMLAMECCVSGFDRCEECPVPQKDKDDCTCGTYVMERAIEKIRELTPPVEIGDEVIAIVEDENRLVSIMHYTVAGLMYRDGKYYACGSDGDFNEVGTRLCLPPKYLDRQMMLGGLTGGVHGESEGA